MSVANQNLGAPAVRTVKLAELAQDDKNANRGTERGAAVLKSSLQRLGAGRSVLIDRNGKLIAGNKTHLNAAEVGIENVIIVPTDGKTLVAVQRTDLDLDSDVAARELAIADNRAGELNLDWDPAVLAELTAAGAQVADIGFTKDELAAMTAGASTDSAAVQLKDLFAVYVECKDEQDQSTLLQSLKTDGREPRAFIALVADASPAASPVPPPVDGARKIIREVSVEVTPRYMQLCGIHDLQPNGHTRHELDLNIELPETWNVGAIVGPSGSFKTTIAREIFGNDRIVGAFDWPRDRCILDGFDSALPVTEIQAILSSVGFSSPRDWLKPFHVLSNGQQFRATLARALAELPDLCVIDEFGAYVDQRVRGITSFAAQKAARLLGRRFVAVGTHDDMLPDLDPDWVYFTETGELARGRLQRRQLELEIIRTTSAAWKTFSPHHYLSADINPSAQCFLGLIDGRPAVFTAVLSGPHPRRPCWREHRTVCLPDFQGRGIGNRMSAYVASLYAATGKPYRSVTSSPAMIRHRVRSPLWRTIRSPSMAHQNHTGNGTRQTGGGSFGRMTATFEYSGEARREDAMAFGIRTR